MKLKITLIAILSCFAMHLSAAEGAFSGKPYTKPEVKEPDLPELGDISQTVLSAQDEQKIAEQILREVAVSEDVLQDAEITDYIQTLGNRLAASGPDKRQSFSFFIVEDNSINAFAMPGGVIGVHTGLLLAANTESELASVLGHEIGHVTQHHLARILASQKYDTFKNIATTALALLLSRANPQLASGAMTAASAATVQRQLDYTRDHEREADRVGLTVLDSAGFDVRAMPAFFNTMQKGTRFVEGTAPSFLRTHPLTSERISDIANRVQNMPYRQVVDSLDFHLVRAKIKANIGLAQNAVETFESSIQDRRYSSEAAEHYGLALALIRKNNLEQAEKEVQWLKKNAPQHAFFDHLSANLEVARKQPSKALQLYSQGLIKYPAHRGLIQSLAELLISQKQPDKAIKLLNDKTSLYPNDASLYQLLAKAYSIKGKVLLKHHAQGEAYFRQYDYNRALEQLELAAKAKDGNFYEHSIVDARLKEIRFLQGAKEYKG